ncbi:type II secretion system assembly factor GspB [Klebsiella pneumoniae]|nr:type II secretion system assembly factor GspB [Klebsiella pneumoniae]
MASPGTAANAALAGGACGASAVNRCRRGRAKDAAAGGKSQRARGAGSGQRYALPPLRYSAHVYASLPEKRSIVLNGKAWTEGDSPLPNLVVEQIQQDVTIFSFNGTTFTPRGAGGLAGRKN